MPWEQSQGNTKENFIIMKNEVIVGRPIEGVTINGLEYLLDDEGEVMVFEDRPKAVLFLRKNGVTYEEMNDLVFVNSIGTCRQCGSPLFPSNIKGYTAQCLTCDEDFYSFEQDCG